MLKHCILVYEKNTIWFFSFETLGRMHKNIFLFFTNFFGILVVLMKTEYFNTWFVFLRHKIQTDIKQNLVEKYTKKLQFFKSIFEKKTFLNWVGPGLPAHVNSGSLYCSYATWTVARPEEEEDREREEGLPAVAHGASSDCGGGNDAASGGWGVRWHVVLASSSSLCRGDSLCFFFSFLLLLDELLLVVAMERRRNSGAVRLKVVSGGPSSSPSSSSIFLCFFFSFIPLFFSFFFFRSSAPSLLSFFLSVFFSSSRAPSLVSAPHLPLYL